MDIHEKKLVGLDQLEQTTAEINRAVVTPPPVSSTIPVPNTSSGSIGESIEYARADHSHPFQKSLALVGDTEWKLTTLPASANWQSLVYGNGKFCSVGYGTDKAVYSEDGVVWNVSTLPAVKNWYAVEFGDGLFVAVGNNTIISSTDAINWTVTHTASNVGTYYRGVGYGNGRFVAAGRYQASYSEDGVNWTDVDVAGMDAAFIYYGERFLATPVNSDKLFYSYDGASWTTITLPHSIRWGTFSYCGKGLYVISDGNGSGLYTYDFITYYSYGKYGTMYENGKIFRLIDDTHLQYGTDLISWKTITLPASADWGPFHYANGRYVMLANNSNLVAYYIPPSLLDENGNDVTELLRNVFL